MRDKITFSVKGFKSLTHPICYSPGAERVFTRYKALCESLNEYEESVYSVWSLEAEERTLTGLSMPLLVRDDKDGTLKVLAFSQPGVTSERRFKEPLHSLSPFVCFLFSVSCCTPIAIRALS